MLRALKSAETLISIRIDFIASLFRLLLNGQYLQRCVVAIHLAIQNASISDSFFCFVSAI